MYSNVKKCAIIENNTNNSDKVCMPICNTCVFFIFSGQPMQTSEFFLVGENTGHGNECGMGMGWVWDGYGMGWV